MCSRAAHRLLLSQKDSAANPLFTGILSLWLIIAVCSAVQTQTALHTAIINGEVLALFEAFCWSYASEVVILSCPFVVLSTIC